MVGLIFTRAPTRGPEVMDTAVLMHDYAGPPTGVLPLAHESLHENRAAGRQLIPDIRILLGRVCVYIPLCLYIYICIYIYIHMCTYSYMHMPTCTLVYIYICIQIHVQKCNSSCLKAAVEGPMNIDEKVYQHPCLKTLREASTTTKERDDTSIQRAAGGWE